MCGCRVLEAPCRATPSNTDDARHGRPIEKNTAGPVRGTAGLKRCCSNWADVSATVDELEAFAGQVRPAVRSDESAFDLEHRNGAVQHGRLLRERMRGGRCLLDEGRVLLRDLIHLCHRLTHLFDAQALLVRGR